MVILNLTVTDITQWIIQKHTRWKMGHILIILRLSGVGLKVIFLKTEEI